MKKILVVMLVLNAFAVTAFAKGGEGDMDKGDGCGLGWQITKDRTMIATTTRGTTNAFVPPTFGMTSGTIGCSQHAIAARDEAGATFAVTNLDALKVEMAQGQGEYLQGFARTFGCNDASVSEFGRMTQDHYKSLSTSSTGIELYNNVKHEIQNDAALSAGCGSV